MRIAPFEAQKLLSSPNLQDPVKAIEAYWQPVSSKCKDICALAIALKDVPATAASYKEASAGAEFVVANFQIVYTPPMTSESFAGWSKAPYDAKKKLQNIKPLYCASEEDKNLTKVLAFTKVSNNMNKGPVIEELIDGKDTSFLLYHGTLCKFFLRENNFEANAIVDVSSVGDIAMIPEYTPVLLQLSGANGEQALKGNGLKLRKIVPLKLDSVAPFMSYFFDSKTAAISAAEKSAKQSAIENVCGRINANMLISCKLKPSAFLHQDSLLQEKNSVEIVDSGLNADIGTTLIVSDKIVCNTMHSDNLQRAIRFLLVAIAHEAVNCLVCSSVQSGVANVQYMHVDFNKMLHLDLMLYSLPQEIMIDYPYNEKIRMMLGKTLSRIEDASLMFTDKKTCLQWYNPSKPAIVSDAQGREKHTFYVFELDVVPTSTPGADEKELFFLRDGGQGFYNMLRVYTMDSPICSEDGGLSECSQADLYLTWQLRSGLPTCSGATFTNKSIRKRPHFAAETSEEQSDGKKIRFADVPESTASEDD